MKPPLPPLPAGAGTGVTYYVSPSGSDSNDGKSEATPWQTLAKVQATSFGPGDTVRLQGGAEFVGCLTLSGDRVKSTTEAPFTLGSYGGKPFRLRASCAGTTFPEGAALGINGINGVVVTDGEIRGNQGGAMYGVLLYNLSGQLVHGVRVQNCDISGFYTPGPGFGGEIFVDGYNDGLDDVKLLNNVLHGSDGPTSLDDNGICGVGNGQNITNVLYQGNEVHDIGGKPGGYNGCEGNGILFNGVSGGVAQYNVVHHNGGNSTTCGGPGGIWAAGASKVTIQYNEVYALAPANPAGPGCDWTAYDLDLNVTGSVIQYNYSHDNRGPGLLAYVAETWSGNTIRYNISQNDGGGVSIGGYKSATTDLAIHNNTIVSAPGAPPFQIGINDSGSVSGHVANNIFIAQGDVSVIQDQPWSQANPAGLLFHGNVYRASGAPHILWKGITHESVEAWAAATGQETLDGQPVGLTVDPQLTKAGGGSTYGGYDPGGLSAYRLLPGSPVRGKGIDLKIFKLDPGSLDYFGGAVPNGVGSGFNVGADGGQ